MLQDAFDGAVASPLELSPHLALLARRQWRGSVRRGSGASAFQRQVVHALRALGAAPALEVMTADGMFCIDTVVTWRGRCGVLCVCGVGGEAKAGFARKPALLWSSPGLRYPASSWAGGERQAERARVGGAPPLLAPVPALFLSSIVSPPPPPGSPGAMLSRPTAPTTSRCRGRTEPWAPLWRADAASRRAASGCCLCPFTSGELQAVLGARPRPPQWWPSGPRPRPRRGHGPGRRRLLEYRQSDSRLVTTALAG
jgi:hypothetical protein